MHIIQATCDHAAEICDVVRRSIVQLCEDDHRADPEIIAKWLDGKTPERVKMWIQNPLNRIMLAAEGDRVLGAGCITSAGEITLNYVLPEARFQGASKAIVAALEAQARTEHHAAITLESTTTAHRFYSALGYRDRGTSSTKFGLTTWPMIKEFGDVEGGSTSTAALKKDPLS